jgi:hydrogenase nickel incorporation protein HypB
MCTTCGCDAHEHHDHHHHDGHHGGHDHHHHEPRVIKFERDLLEKNNRLASENRSSFHQSALTVLNIIGTPGAGKTALLEATVKRLDGLDVAVLEGDQATDHDARRIREAGARAYQINTDTGCHLDAEMVAHGLDHVGTKRGSIVFVENVGNLVCPALFDLGEHAKVVVMSVTEGADKPLKYPHVFRAASLFLLNKVDLAPYVSFDIDQCIGYARQIHPDLEVIPISATRGDGLDAWCNWIRRTQPRA